MSVQELSPEHQAVRDEWRERIMALIARVAVRGEQPQESE